MKLSTNVFSNVLQRARPASAKNLFLSFALFLALSVGGVMSVSTMTQSGRVDAASACGDDSSNSIIRNGASSRRALIAKVKDSPSLQKIYASRGLTAKDYTRFINDAQAGSATSNNTIVVGGDVVATSVGSLGRIKSCQGSGARTFSVKGVGDLYGNLNSKAFANGTSKLPVDVLFDGKGQVQFAVMTSDCANPTYQTPVKPNYVCHSLQAKSLGNNSYSFTTDAEAGHGAKITKLVYDFGNGQTKTTTNPNTAVTHTFDTSTTVTVKIYVSLPGGGQTILTNCEKRITVIPPAVFACNLLQVTAGAFSNGKQSYVLKATASASNATIKSYTFTFGDGTTRVVTTNNTATSTTHDYAPGNYTATVSLTVLTNKGETKTVTAPKCAQPVTVKAPECKPGVPVGSPQCNPSNLACVNLSLVPGTVNTDGSQILTLKATATATNATITSYIFDFGDKTALQTVATAATTASSAAHTYAAGDFTASVTVNGTDAAGKKISATAPACQVPVHGTPVQPKSPGIKITKTVDSQKAEQVAVGQNFTYQLVITNTGEQDLTNAVVSDPAPQGVTLISADLGAVANNSFSYTIPSLAIGDSVTVNITAVVNTYVAGNLVNQACVNAPEVNPTQPTQPDSCDTATVTVTPPAPFTVLPNTGAGNIVGIFGAIAVLGTIGHRLFLSRRLSRQS